METLVNQNSNNHQDQALAIAKLGDWYLIFGQRQAAKQAYKLALDALATPEDSNSIEGQKAALFDTPSIIKFDIEGAGAQTVSEETVEVAMTVSPAGTVSDIEVINSQQEISKKQLSNLRRNLRTMRLRPRLENGAPVTSSHSELFSLSILDR